LPWDDGDEDAFRVGVAMSIGEVIGIVTLAWSISLSSGVGGWLEKGEDVLEEESSIKATSK
jgi:hypothetical protein